MEGLSRNPSDVTVKDKARESYWNSLKKGSRKKNGLLSVFWVLIQANSPKFPP